ncbi:MAG: DinB family protein [Ilumatobacteraceae bacterium]
MTELPHIDEVGTEHAMLSQFLDYYRAVFARKIEDLDETAGRQRLAPGAMHLLGMTRHMADVERWWFRRFFAGETIEPLYDTTDDPDIDWHPEPHETLSETRQVWFDEVEACRAIVVASTDLDALAWDRTGHRGDVSLRWIMIHMIEEYARHCGHADLIRESIDGATGD